MSERLSWSASLGSIRLISEHQLIYEAISDKDEASARIRMQDPLRFL
jgi:DNA-binding FadR family transcriptional regulator